ncbi:MAG: hypothetical protein MPJ50_07845 [Pirellulales bacterium]|nr:hypothetical protein [Pirellulales bacterium]
MVANDVQLVRRDFLRTALACVPAAGMCMGEMQHAAAQVLAASAATFDGKPHRVAGVPVSLESDDYTVAGLQRTQKEVLAAYGVSHRDLPLDAKASYYEWQLWRYHLTNWNQVHHAADLPAERGEHPRTVPGSDSSTWNGALLAALAHKYAVTHDAETLRRVNQLLWGMNFFFEVTRKSGLPARNVVHADGMVLAGQTPYDAPDGNRYFYLADPAKGTFNQIAIGLAAVMMYVESDLPEPTRAMLRTRLAEFVLHLIDHDYHITGADGKRTSYGDLTPVFAGVGVPFNAQVAFHIIYLGQIFAPQDATQRQRIADQYRRLRDKHHVYFERPWKSLIQPQRVAASPIVKGMNDRNHAINAAFSGLLLERYQAARDGRGIDETFVYRLGQTMYWGLQKLERSGNSLCNFMYLALLADDAMFSAMAPERPDQTRKQMTSLLSSGIEQLRRFPLDRFHRPGVTHSTREPTGIDARRGSDFYWKEPEYEVFRATGPINGRTNCGTDYLYAYWLMRHFELDRSAAVSRRHGGVLERSLKGRSLGEQRF